MRRDEAYLLDMLPAARDAHNCVRGLTRHQFEQSRVHPLAALKTLETIGGTTAKVSKAFRVAHS